ncbi:M23 family metallopeptidase [Branchiibius sp. NY16-3462-2]|uniref:M23 family metallopeptidase n=1 Tax=Branchiibius sp. NY16-3462-2 TaxID=1807500 RepID=UPI000795FAD2|nr:M23 family metallopeptidase [Branchiibius sp. NY16-3462-2]KYH43216.1 hypothetical protein AZH51_12740 [Branchiibius sp. NY16-3462-2]
MQVLLAVVMGIANALAVTPAAVPATSYAWPIPLPHSIFRPFEAPPHPWSAGHRGVDLAAAGGTAIVSAGPGVVTFSGMVAGRGVVAVRHPDGRRTTYEPLDDRVTSGTQVIAGTPLGRLSVSGSHCAPSACLHWGLLVGDDQYRDPLSLLRTAPIVLLPTG